MLDFLRQPFTQAVIWSCVAALLGVGIWFALGRLRDREEDEVVGTSDLMTKFREMHAQGVLSDEEFRTIKANLTARLQQELSDSESTG